MSSVVIAALILGGLGLWGAFVAWRWRDTFALTEEVYAAKLEQGELKSTVRADDFKDAFVRSTGPRFATYIFAAGALCALLVPATIGAFNFVWDQIWYLTGEDPVFAQGLLLHSVLLIFVYGALFFAVCALAMLRYHRNAPPSLRAEIRRLNGEI
ncbi:MAG: hypothetical protein AAFX03_07510 [Pseudomonadota bacterium]